MSDFTFDKKSYFGKGAENWLLAIGITLLSICISSPEAVAQIDRYVSTTGVNAGDCSDPMNPCLTIQYAISQSVAGDNVHVGAGTYNENVTIDRSLSLYGYSAATVIGTDITLGTFLILPGVDDVTIHGFTIIGFDSPNPGLEKAAVYVQGNHNNLTIQNNIITAAGEAGYLEEFGMVNTNTIITGNTFNGKTFVGSMPAGCGFTMQFTLHNVPRQLVVVSNNSSNVTFTNNIISGTTGGPSTEMGCTVTGQGNNLVTIDATNVTITGNTFNGTMYGSSSMLRARGTQVSVSGNTFDGSNLNGSTYYLFFDNDALVGGTPSDVAGVVGSNTFLPAAAHVTSGTNFLIISCSGPVLNTSINSFVSNETGNDGINDTVSFSVCNISLNILFNTFTDVFTPALPNVRVYQIRETSNLTVPFCNNCSAMPSAFTGATGTAALINHALPGTLTMKFFAFSDANGNTTYETSECRGDTVVYIITVNPIPQLTAQTPSICPSQNPFNLTSLQTSITSATGTFTYSFGGSPIMDPTAFTAGDGDVVNVTFTDGNGCSNTTTITFTLLPAPPVSILPFAGNPFTQVCVGVEARFLASATAAGPPDVQSYMWTFTGSPVLNNYGQTAVDGTGRNMGAIYSNAAVGPQTVNLTVNYTNGCSSTAPTHTIIVNPLPTVTCPADTIVCEDAGNIDLTTLIPSASPAGGTFAGTYVMTGNLFNTASAGLGTHSVRYIYTDINGCVDSCVFNIIVYDIPSAPQLNKVPNVTFACTGDILSAGVLTSGTGGSGSCEDQYRFSTDNGMTWSSWSASIPYFSAVAGVNIIEARRFCNTNRCPSDITSISWNVNAPITAVNISVAPTGDVCLGAIGVQYTANVTGGTGPFTYAWCAYNSGDGSGTCFGGFSPGGSNPIQTINWVTSTGPNSVGVTVSQEGCPNVTALYSFNVVADPVRPSLAIASPTTSYACQGTNVSATFNAGTGGTGSCSDEYRFSTDNGTTWSAYVPGSPVTMGTQTVLIQTRRVCDGLGCDDTGEVFATVVSWTSSLLPTPSIVPDPAEVCAGADLQLDGNPSGGTGTYDTHLWSGPGAAFVGPDNEQVTVFNNTSSGTYTVIYTVTDSNGCTGTDEINVLVNENPEAEILPATVSEFICPGKNLLLNGNPSGGDGNYIHQWEDDFNFNIPNVQSPVFNSLILGEYTVTYTVTDGNGCTATDAITFTVGDEVDPEITCPIDVTLATDPDVCVALHTFTVEFSDNCAGLDIVGFEEEFAPSNWTLTNSTMIGNGTVDESMAPSSITITGSNFGSVSGPSNNTDYCVTIPGTTAGMLTFDWSYTSLDGDGPFWDKFGYVVDGVFTQVSNDAGPVNQMGSVTINLMPGQEFCFRILSVDQGFGAAVTITMNFGYMENINPMLSQTEGLPSGSDFPLGTTINTFVVTDFAGNTNSCSFTVTVEDRQNPVAICPGDIDITLNPLECGRILEFAADGSDNCSIEDIRQTEGLLSGSFFPIGKDTITFVVEDGSGNTASCSFTVTVRDFPHPPLGCIPVHLSLDEECTAELTALNVLTGYLGPDGEILLGCLDCFIIDVKAPNGTSLGNTVDGTYLGKTLNYTIVNTKSGFSCWNTVLIEDKIKPTIECRNDTISCMAPLSTAKTPLVRDNCGAKAVQVDERFERLECNEIAIGRYIRTWKAVDNYGNESMTCSDTVYLRRTNLEGLEFPGDMTLSCSSGFATDSKGFPYPAPSVGGVPTLNGVNLFPFNNSLICNGTVHYNDHLFLNTACKKMILRTWTITEWWCSTTVTYNMPPQIFTIIDDKAPMIPVVADITVTTKSRACDADVVLPALNITDDCNDLKTVYINATLNGTPSGFLGSNGGTLQLTAGVHTVEYTAFDICGNSSTKSFTVTVRDLTPPIAICDHLNTVSLNNQGYAKATALAIDNGSFDECGPVDLKIQRMEDPCGNGFNVGWHDEVEFCCEDAGKTRMVTLLVTDAGGNTNMCMVSVQVQDKIPPAMSCPANITEEDCTFTFDPNNAGAVFGNPEIFDNCPSNNTIREVLVDGRNNCGIGVVTRTFTLVSGGQSYGTCVQTIEFRNLEPFDAYNPEHLTWPRDTMLNSVCSPLNLLPESLGDLHGFPIIIEDACDLVGMNYEDQIFYFANNNACFKILRTWSIIDWCQKNTDGTYKVWTWEQEIKVVDNTAPVITSSAESRMVCTYDSECQSGVILGLIATATDCTPDSMLQWSYKVYDIDVNPHVLYTSGIGNDVSGTYPVGKYRVDFTVLDRCGNIATTSYNFEIRNCKAPTAICKVGLATSLTMMDTNNDGTGDTPQVMIRPEFFNNKSYHPCNYDLKFSFSANVNDTLRTFTCDSVGMRNIQMWVTDVNGNTSFCTTFISVQDSMNLCTGNRIAVSGTVKTEEQQEVTEVMVYLNNGEGGQSMTNDEGKYIFEELQTGGTYAFRPEKKGDDKNGVTTLDIVMIQRHILGMQPLSSPYKLLAADVNKSGSISSADLLEIRKLILGLYDRLPVVDSWKFVDRNYQFPDPSAPWLGVLPEECIVSNIYQNKTVNFVAVKMGDVNGSAKGNYNGTPLEHRSTCRFWMEEGTVTQDNVRRIPVRAGNDQTLYGMQMMLHFRDIEYANIVPACIRIAAQEMVKFGKERIALSISIPEGIRVREGDVLFYIELKSGVGQEVKHLISIGTEVNPEVYTDGMYEQQLTMQWRNVESNPFDVLNVQPNPWKDHTFIHLTMPESAMVSFKVKDLSGRKVLSRVEQLQKGLNQIMITSSELIKAGVYIFEVKYANQTITGKMIMVE